jgi:predicted lipoprotein with Yx(FWY)xxD motif
VLLRSSIQGLLLTTAAKQPLYWFTGESAKKWLCTEHCLTDWKPLGAPAGGRSSGDPDWKIVQRPSGSPQWQYRGKPLYTYAGDVEYGDLSGLDEKGWSLAVLRPPSFPPADVTIQMTADGEVFADRNGLTLYTWSCQDEAPDRLPCDVPDASQSYWRSICGPAQQCVATWRPVLVTKRLPRAGPTWSIVMLDPTGANLFAPPGSTTGVRAWAYHGRPVFTFVKDRRPGDIFGHHIGSIGWGYNMLRATGVILNPLG